MSTKKAAKKKIKQTASKRKATRRKTFTKEMGDIRVFKYRPVNKYLIDSLVKSQLHFSLPSQLNDPYDCQVDLKKAIERAVDNLKGREKKKLKLLLSDSKLLATIRRLLRKTAVCSFSDSLLNPVLWSHYADGHRGISLLYEIPQSLVLNTSTNIIGYSGVEYDENALTRWFEKTPVQFDINYYVGIIKQILTIKGPTWEYEGESRIMRSRSGGLEIDTSYLTQICFGLRTPKSDRELIRKITEKNYSKMHFCKIIGGDSDFGLKAIDI